MRTTKKADGSVILNDLKGGFENIFAVLKMSESAYPEYVHNYLANRKQTWSNTQILKAISLLLLYQCVPPEYFRDFD